MNRLVVKLKLRSRQRQDSDQSVGLKSKECKDFDRRALTSQSPVNLETTPRFTIKSEPMETKTIEHLEMKSETICELPVKLKRMERNDRNHVIIKSEPADTPSEPERRVIGQKRKKLKQTNSEESGRTELDSRSSTDLRPEESGSDVTDESDATDGNEGEEVEDVRAELMEPEIEIVLDSECEYQVDRIPVKRYLCDFCDFKTNALSNLEQHRRTHTGEKPFKCCFCLKSFARLNRCKLHEQSHANEGKPVCCDICQESFALREELSRHIKEVHKTTHKTCPLCFYVCGIEGGVIKHFLEVHPMIKSYVCEACGYLTFRPDSLKLHYRKHTGEKPLSCNVCGKSFADPSTLRKHLLRHGTICPPTPKPYACITCGHLCASPAHLECHMRTHSGEKPFSCSDCDKVFTQMASLRRHHLSHGNIDAALVKCHLCSYQAKLPHQLRAHLRKIHETRALPMSESPLEESQDD